MFVGVAGCSRELRNGGELNDLLGDSLESEPLYMLCTHPRWAVRYPCERRKSIHQESQDRWGLIQLCIGAIKDGGLTSLHTRTTSPRNGRLNQRAATCSATLVCGTGARSPTSPARSIASYGRSQRRSTGVDQCWRKHHVILRPAKFPWAFGPLATREPPRRRSRDERVRFSWCRLLRFALASRFSVSIVASVSARCSSLKTL